MTSGFVPRQPLECEICEGRAWATLLIVLDLAWQVFHKYMAGRQAWPEEYSHQSGQSSGTSYYELTLTTGKLSRRTKHFNRYH